VVRPQVLTRIAVQDDLPVLLALWDELRIVGGRAERAVNPLTAVDVRDRLLEALLDPECRVMLACAEDQPAGMAVLQVIRPDPLSDIRLVHVVHIVVSRMKRHRGIGHALIATAADFANERRIDHVAVSVYPSLRDASRFYARLGFAPVAVRRIAPVAVLRRRLGNDPNISMLADAARRRTRLMRPVQPQRNRRSAGERVDS
jgi:ribosomal protein S18 acetylase RimI-like enzyme